MTSFVRIALPKPESPASGTIPSAVLVALLDEGGAIKVILTQRASNLRHHAGQISFPGGAINEGESPAQAALREAEEEINLKPKDVKVLGYLPGVITTAGFHIAPVLGIVQGTPNLTPAQDEVARILIEDITPLLNPSNFKKQVKQHQGKDYQTWVIDHPKEYIWGATAKLLVQYATLFHQQNLKGI